MTVTDLGGTGRRAVPSPASRLTALTTGVAVLLTLAVVGLPVLDFAYRAPHLHVMLETSNALVAILVAYLVLGRFRQQRRLQELLLVLALTTVAVANMVLTALPDALALPRAESFGHWGALVVRLLGTVVLGVAALTPAGVRVGPRGTRVAVGTLVAVLALIAGAWVAWDPRLPAVGEPPASAGPVRALLGHPVVVAIHGAGVVLYAVAAAAFTRQAARTHDELLRWVAAGCVLASVARVHYLLEPPLASDHVHTGDALRLGFYALMLVGAGREITSFWRARAETAVLEDRRRIARDLHDGLIQELAYIHAQTERLTARPGDPVVVGRIGEAADRAIDESRRALTVLTSDGDGDLPVALRHTLGALATRYDVDIGVQLDPRTEGDGPITEAMLRIAGEAVRNAVRHGAATHVDVTLTAIPLSLRVRDNGLGFDVVPDGPQRPGGFGLTSMRERAEAVGATLTVESTPGEGTTVRVSWV